LLISYVECRLLWSLEGFAAVLHAYNNWADFFSFRFLLKSVQVLFLYGIIYEIFDIYNRTVNSRSRLHAFRLTQLRITITIPVNTDGIVDALCKCIEKCEAASVT
jgi:hypothetical protein